MYAVKVRTRRGFRVLARRFASADAAEVSGTICAQRDRSILSWVVVRRVGMVWQEVY